MNENRPLGEIKQNLLDPRRLSKQEDQSGRSELAGRIVALRRARRSLEGKRQDLVSAVASTEQEKRSSTDLESQLTKQSLERLDSLIVRLKHFVRLGDKRALEIQRQLAEVSSNKQQLIARMSELRVEIESLENQIDAVVDPREELRQYYESISDTPLTVEQKKTLLTPEFLASLSMEEYIKLWKKLNPQFLSHVTRQGFRDHTGLQTHQAGLNEQADGFTRMLDDGKILRPPMALKKLHDREHGTVKKALAGWVLEAEDQTEAERRFTKWLDFTFASAPNYPDETAIHFAAQTVADTYYGGETGNEIFYLFPTDTIASQSPFAFNGWEKDFTKPQSELMWNDLFVWPDPSREGIQVDAGIVFLPNSTPVDKTTGSKYDSRIDAQTGKRHLVVDMEQSAAFHHWCADRTSSSLGRVLEAIEQYKNEHDEWYGGRDRARSIAFEVASRELQALDFSRDAADDLAYQLVLRLAWDDDALDFPELREMLLTESRAAWKRPEELVTAKEYWEAYFDSNPEKRPKHIVYYDGTPSVAVREFQQQNGIGQSTSGVNTEELLGFEENHVVDMETDERAWEGYDELVALGQQIIQDHYAGREKKVNYFE